jgi:hypothetical protein
MKKELTKHIFKSDRCEVAVFAETEKQARLQLSHAKEYRHLRVETVPLVHALFALGLRDALGEGWTAEPIHDEYPDTQFSFRHKNGVSFWVRDDGKRLEFRYDRPHDTRGHTYSAYWPDGRAFVSPSITCSKSKSGEQLAKDIVRRLLPDCEAAEVVCQKAIREAKAYRAKCELAKEAADSLSFVNGIGFTASGGSVHVGGYVTPETARKIHALLSK